MATWKRSEETINRVGFTLPMPHGSTWAEVEDVMHAALADHFEYMHRSPLPSDIRVTARDGEVVFWFEVPGHCASCDRSSCDVHQ